MARYLIVIEKASGNFSAYSPDLPGCVATGKTQGEVTQNMRQAIELHLMGMKEDHLPIPKPVARADYVVVTQD
jgi:predicted RNase H-like HicB family nuclease